MEDAQENDIDYTERIPPNLYQHLNKFISQQDKVYNNAVTYARELDLKLVTLNALSNLNQLKISQLTKVLRDKIQQSKEMLYNIQIVRNRKNLNETLLLQEINTVINQATQQAEEDIKLEGLKAKAQHFVPEIKQLEPNNDHEIFKQLMKMLREKVTQKYIIYQDKIKRENELDVKLGMIESLKEQWMLKIAKLQRNSKFFFQRTLLDTQKRMHQQEENLLTNVGYYLSKSVDQLINHIAVYTPELYKICAAIEKGEILLLQDCLGNIGPQ